MSSAELLRRLASVPRTELGTHPTPLRRARNLEARLGAGSPRIVLKLDAHNGFGLGGNKVRKLEFELGPDRLRGVTHLVTCGGVQSNHARVAAAAAARLGLSCVLVLSGPEPSHPTGNARLHRLLGARIRSVESREDREPVMEETAREIEADGGRALVVPLGASTPRGALGYAAAAAELHDQLGPAPSTTGRVHVVVPSSSCGTLAGLVLGFGILGRDDVALLGISADVPAGEILESTAALVEGAARILGWEGPDPMARVQASDAQVGEGYGVPTPASRSALELLARTEGVLLDPTYTAKAAAWLVGAVREGELGPGDTAVFLHTGGLPALLA